MPTIQMPLLTLLVFGFVDSDADDFADRVSLLIILQHMVVILVGRLGLVMLVLPWRRALWLFAPHTTTIDLGAEYFHYRAYVR